MKANRLIFYTLTAALVLSLQSCLKDKCERQVTYIRLDPVYKTAQEIHDGTAVNEAPRALTNPGQLYFFNDYIFINERNEGIHVLDNSNPKQPVNTAFIAIPGNNDLAIKDGILYANSYIDLLAIDLQNFPAAPVVGRVENVFPPLWEDLQNNVLLVGYDETEVTEELDCQSYGSLYQTWNGSFVKFEGGNAIDVLTALEDNSGGFAGGGTGIGGSMARFTIVGDYLYVIDNTEMDVFNLEQATQPALSNTVNIGWGIETIFPYQDKLFIGSNSGMFIFDNSNPTNPVQLAAFAHARACDPVYVKGNYAYVTLRDGTECQGFVNQLDLVDISNITSPVLKKTFQMEHPHGLSIRENDLFLCEGKHGLKAFDVTNPLALDSHLLDKVSDLNAWDVIALPGEEKTVLVIGEDGFYQYNAQNPSDLKLLSKIPVSR